ncbi:MAG TPA: lamin tail domain-containing protein [Kofleriaceae bacterium]|nr:lamin tail domain-containing protein [Kofleriaceae bacterium]
MRVARIAAALVACSAAAACGPADHEGDCVEDLVAGDLVITEVFTDYQAPGGGTGIDDGKEWIEIYNASGRPLELRGLTVLHSRADGSREQSHVIDVVTIAPGQFFTMGNSAQDLLPPYTDYGYRDDLGDLLNSGSGKLELRCDGVSIDTAIYSDVRAGRSRQLTAAQAPDYTVNDGLENWCEAAATEFEPGNFGTPGQDNDCAPVIAGKCSDGGALRDTVGPAPGDLVITEVMPGPASVGDTDGEWFEARVLTDLDLNGVGLDRAGDTAKPDLIEQADCLRVIAGMHVVFVRNTDPLVNGGLVPYGVFRFSLVSGSATSPGDVRILNGATVVDAVSWTSSRSGRSLSLDPDFTNVTANDEAANFCDGATAYNTSGTGTDFGTPGAQNAQCPLQPPAGQCLAGGVPRAIVKPQPGKLVITELLANPAGTGTDAAQEWFELANTGTAAFDLNGLTVQGNTAPGNVVSAADCKSVPPGGFALLAHGTDPTANGMLPPVDATFSFALAQSNGSIKVLDGATVLDAVTWTSGAQDGASRQLPPGMITTTANDNPDAFCNALPTQKYGSADNLGTPKAANVCP